MRRPQLDILLNAMLDAHPSVSDLVFAVGKPPQVYADGELREALTKPHISKLSPFQTERIALNVIGENPRLWRDIFSKGSCDCSYPLGAHVRLRVSIIKQRGCFNLVMRRTLAEVPTIAGLGLPSIFTEVCRETSGIVLVTGPSGSGKTTTLTALVDEINSTQPVHIITLEDPIEFVHDQKRATLSQRELGSDFPDFASGLRSAVRQNPRVILLGEIRDATTLEIALNAGETGHLVLASIHAATAAQTIHRIVAMHDPAEQSQVRLRLLENLRYVVAQRLLPKLGGGRQLVQEIMGANLRTRDVLLNGEGENRNYYDIIDANASFGWCTFDQSLTKAFAAGTISEDSALLYATNRNKLNRMLDDAKKQMGQAMPTAGGLRLDGPPVPAQPAPKGPGGFRLSA